MRARRTVVLVLSVIVAGCGSTPSTASPSRALPSASIATDSATPLNGASGSASPSLIVDRNTMPPAYVLEQGSFPTADTTPLQDVKTDGSLIFWSCGVGAAPNAAPDLWDALPGGQPGRIFSNPNRDSALLPIAGAGGHFAFVEANQRLYGPNGWRLWYLDHPGARAVQLDASDGPNGGLPLLAMTGERLVWAAFHGPQGHATSELLMATLPDLTKHVLARSPAADKQYLFPSLLGNQLAYGVEDIATGQEHVDLLNLGRSGAIPRRLDSSGQATMPALTTDSVIWKEGVNIFSAGALVRYSLHDGTTTALDLGTWGAALYPTAGRRFASAWGWDTTQFYVVDLSMNRAVLLERFPAVGPLNDVRPYIAGDLLVWSRGVSTLDARGYPTQPLELEWARLAP